MATAQRRPVRTPINPTRWKKLGDVVAPLIRRLLE